MADSPLRQAGTQAGKRVVDTWQQLSRTVGSKMPTPPAEVQRLLDSLGQGLLDYSDSLIKPLRQLLKSHRDFIDQTEQWAQMQIKFNEQTIEWARRQREVYANIEAILKSERNPSTRRKSSGTPRRASPRAHDVESGS
jgi:thiamine monophosphate kinase